MKLFFNADTESEHMAEGGGGGGGGGGVHANDLQTDKIRR